MTINMAGYRFAGLPGVKNPVSQLFQGKMVIPSTREKKVFENNVSVSISIRNKGIKPVKSKNEPPTVEVVMR